MVPRLMAQKSLFFSLHFWLLRRLDVNIHIWGWYKFVHKAEIFSLQELDSEEKATFPPLFIKFLERMKFCDVHLPVPEMRW